MIIHGKERGFRFTIRASIEMAELCPDKDISRMGELLDGKSFQEMALQVAKLAIIMNKADEEAVAYEGTRERIEPITEDEMMTLTTEEFTAVQQEIFKAYGADTTRTVEVEPSKKNGAEEAESGKSS